MKIISSIANSIYELGVDKADIMTDQDIVDVANQIKDLGYDLYGYGFIPIPEDQAFIFEDYPDGKNGNEEGGKLGKDRKIKSIAIEEAPSVSGFAKYLFKVGTNADKNTYRNIMAYIAADTYTHTVKNLSETFGEKWERRYSEFKSYFTGSNVKSYAKGLISLYKGDELWTPPSVIDKLDMDYLTIKINNSNLTVVFHNGFYGQTQTKYSLDGWTGRYGMPLEFLLSVHIATMAPDLAYRLTQDFETDVKIKLQSSDIVINSRALVNGKEYNNNTYKEKIGSGVENISGFDNDLVIGAMKSLELESIKGHPDSIYNCTGPLTNIEIINDPFEGFNENSAKNYSFVCYNNGVSIDDYNDSFNVFGNNDTRDTLVMLSKKAMKSVFYDSSYNSYWNEELEGIVLERLRNAFAFGGSFNDKTSDEILQNFGFLTYVKASDSYSDDIKMNRFISEKKLAILDQYDTDGTVKPGEMISKRYGYLDYEWIIKDFYARGDKIGSYGIRYQNYDKYPLVWDNDFKNYDYGHGYKDFNIERIRNMDF